MDNSIKIRFFGRKFLELCKRSRNARKPILIIMLRDDSEETYEYVSNALGNETIQEMIGQTYNVYGFYRDRVDSNLANVLEFPSHAIMSIWVLIVRAGHQIQINSRLAGSEDEFRQECFLNYLTENLSLFHIMSEEDAEYKQADFLRDCKISH